MRFLVMIGLGAALVWGQDVQGVASGVMYDAPSRAVRVFEGVVGSAHLGTALAEDVDAAWLSPDGRAGVVKRGGVWHAVKELGREGEEWKAMESEVVVVRWSADGGAAAVVLEGGRSVRVWAMEAMEWIAGADLEGMEGEVSSVALAGPGQVYAGVWTGAATRVVQLCESGWKPLGEVRGRGHVAVGGDGRVYGLGERELAVWAGGEQVRRVETGREDAAVGLEWAGRALAAAYGGEKPELLIWDVENGAVQRKVELETTPDRLGRLAGGAGLVLKERKTAAEETWVAAERWGEWGVWFVPVGE